MKAAARIKEKTEERKDFSAYTVSCDTSISEAFKKHDLNKERLVLVLNKAEKVVGTATSADIHKVIWDAQPMEEPIEYIMNRDFVYLVKTESGSRAEKIFATTKIRQI